jgi:excisionase family DNA binding protein
MLLKVSEAAELLRIDIGTAHKWITKGVLPHVRFGRTIRIDRDDLLRLAKGLPSPAAIDVIEKRNSEKNEKERCPGVGDE